MNNGNKLDFQFWTGFYDDNNCFEWASNKAYRDMNRTMTFKEVGNSEKEKNDIKKSHNGQFSMSVDNLIIINQ